MWKRRDKTVQPYGVVKILPNKPRESVVRQKNKTKFSNQIKGRTSVPESKNQIKMSWNVPKKALRHVENLAVVEQACACSGSNEKACDVRCISEVAKLMRRFFNTVLRRKGLRRVCEAACENTFHRFGFVPAHWVCNSQNFQTSVKRHFCCIVFGLSWCYIKFLKHSDWYIIARASPILRKIFKFRDFAELILLTMPNHRTFSLIHVSPCQVQSIGARNRLFKRNLAPLFDIDHFVPSSLLNFEPWISSTTFLVS